MRYISQVAAFVGGALSAAVAATTLFSFFTTVNSIDDVVSSLNDIANAVSETDLSSSSTEDLTLALEALGSVSQAIEQSVENSGDSGSYLRVFNGVFDLPEGSAVDLDSPSGDFVSFGFHRFKKGSETWAGVYFDGVEHGLLPGQVLRFAENKDTCQIMYVGPVDAEETAARFRFRCPNSAG
ncbi:MAG: hypothetical protein ABJL99_19750 [Aliishimia sp.]